MLKKSATYYFFCLIFGLFANVFVTQLLFAAEGKRTDIISKELDCVTKRMNEKSEFSWDDVCYTDKYSGSDFNERETKVNKALDDAARPTTRSSQSKSSNNSQYKIYTKDDKTEFEIKSRDDAVREPVRSAKKSKDMGSIFSKQKKLTFIDFGTEMYLFQYKEPTWPTPVRWDGEFLGLFGSFTHRFSENEPIKSISDTFTSKSKVNMVRFDARYAFGTTDYEGSGTYKGINDNTFEVRGVAGYDMPYDRNAMITPYMGLGYRYLFDGFAEAGAGGYDREETYWYMPIGIDTSNELISTWFFETNLEYDLFLMGKMVVTDQGENMNFDPTEMKQEGGYGLRGSLRLAKDVDKLRFFIEPFIRYWRIDDSQITAKTEWGSSSGTVSKEPLNNTTEWGLKLGIRY